ncbi:MAG: hypothetical protein ABIQ95_01575 [Bdellovibrionia bacterium]
MRIHNYWWRGKLNLFQSLSLVIVIIPNIANAWPVGSKNPKPFNNAGLENTEKESLKAAKQASSEAVKLDSSATIKMEQHNSAWQNAVIQNNYARMAFRDGDDFVADWHTARSKHYLNKGEAFLQESIKRQTP